MRLLLTSLYFSCMLIPMILSGQDNIAMTSQTKGFSAGIHFAYLSYNCDELHLEAQKGAGFGVKFQYGFSHQLSASLDINHYAINSASSILENNPYPYTEIDLLGDYTFGSSDQSLRPYLAAGINYSRNKESFYNTNDDYIDATYSGYSICGGGGLAYFFNTKISVDFSVLITTGSFSKIVENRVQLDDSLKYSSVKGLLGLMYHF